MRSADLFAKALRHHQAGELAEADKLYGKLLKAEPSHVHALHLRGVLAHQAGRHEDAVRLIGKAISGDPQVADFHYNIAMVHWTCARRADAIAHWSKAVALRPDHADAQMNLGNALWADGKPGEAVVHLTRAVALNPRAAAARSNLGLALAALGRHAEAIAEYAQALALKSDLIETHMNAAVSLQALGRSDEALASAVTALRLKETPESKALTAEMIADLDQVRDTPEMRALIIRVLREGWGRQTDVAGVGTVLLKLDAALAPLLARAAAGPARIEAAELPVENALLRCLLECERVSDAAIESFLTACRAAVLAGAAESSPPDTLVAFACALARQCFATEYVYGLGDEERAQAERLRDAVAAALAAGATVAPLRLAAVASYVPLQALPGHDALLATPWPPAVDALLTQQLRDPREEALARQDIPRLTPIRDDVSRLVRDQYEENPYPRWMSIVAPARTAGLDARLRRQFPRAAFEDSGKGAEFDALVAGCGTGQHALYVARLFGGARVLAIDLSLASLGYAKAKTQALGVSNLDYAQADILELGALDRSFDLIESNGVLHHLGDPWAGWRVLLDRLRPGGFMHLGLYSALARRDVVAVRETIAARGLGASTEEIRHLRTEIMRLPEGDPRRGVMRYNDFFATSDCRDLLFHVSEHRLTLTEIKAFLDANGLRFIGFELDGRAVRAYQARFPEDRAMTDLDNWHAFEAENPYTFTSMYRFWIQKPKHPIH